MKIATTHVAYFNAGSRISLAQHERPFVVNKEDWNVFPQSFGLQLNYQNFSTRDQTFHCGFHRSRITNGADFRVRNRKKAVYHHSNVLYKRSQTHHPNQDTSVIRDIFRVANKSRKPPDDFSPSTGASNGSWGISFPLNRAISARPFSACSTLPLTRSHLGDSGISL